MTEKQKARAWCLFVAWCLFALAAFQKARPIADAHHMPVIGIWVLTAVLATLYLVVTVVVVLAGQITWWAFRTLFLDAPESTKCECEEPGFFHSGVPGILAHMKNGRLAPGAGVERCDLCQRYASDAAALEKLRRRGLTKETG